MLLIAVFLPLVCGLLCMYWPRHARWIAGVPCVATLGLCATLGGTGQTVSMQLLDSYGVAILFDTTAAWFMLTNALVCLAVLWHENTKGGGRRFFFTLLTLLHGCLNACFISSDFLNLYVVIELTTISAFLLIGQGMRSQHLWNALRYLLLSNVGMLFFLLGILQVYEVSGSFAFAGFPAASATARALIVTGLLVKGGVFLPGLWLPQAHARAETGVSALLSGVVVNIGLLPLLRLAILMPESQQAIRWLAMAGAALGLSLAFCQRDVKRLLACSTVSQVGFILVAPAAGAFYACAHGLAKAALFLCVDGLPQRDLARLREEKVPRPMLVPLILGALSIAGCPLLMGFSAKETVLKSLTRPETIFMTIMAAGTAGLMMRLILLPHRPASGHVSRAWQAPLGLCLALVSVGVWAGPYVVSSWLKAGGLLVAGWAVHQLGLKHLAQVRLPSGWEKLEHVVGLTCLVLMLLLMMGDRL